MSDPALPHRQDLFLAAAAIFAHQSLSKCHLKEDPYETSKWKEGNRNLWAFNFFHPSKDATSAVCLNTLENTGPFDASINVLIRNVLGLGAWPRLTERTGHRFGGPLRLLEECQGFSRRWVLDWCRVFLFIPRNHLKSSDVRHTAGKAPPVSLAPLTHTRFASVPSNNSWFL